MDFEVDDVIQMVQHKGLSTGDSFGLQLCQAAGVE
jgi:hypothetical protein